MVADCVSNGSLANGTIHNMPERESRLEQEPRFSPAQELHFKLIELASANNLDGFRIVQDLKANPGIWKAALIGNFGAQDDLRALRDLQHGFNNADTLMVLTDQEHAAAALEMAWHWNSDEADFLPQEETRQRLGDSASELKVLRLRWD